MRLGKRLQKCPFMLPNDGRTTKKKYILGALTLRSLDYIVRHEAMQKMRVGPSESACRNKSRLD